MNAPRKFLKHDTLPANVKHTARNAVAALEEANIAAYHLRNSDNATDAAAAIADMIAHLQNAQRYVEFLALCERVTH